jgi:FdrA protein
MKTKLLEMLRRKPVVVNIGVRTFAETLHEQGAEVVHVEWTPPAGGDREVAELLEKLL